MRRRQACRIRGHHFGEGEYQQSELLIRSLLEEAGQPDLPPLSTDIQGKGIEVAADNANVQSSESEMAQLFAYAFTFG